MSAKVGVLSHSVPPDLSGHTVVLERLFEPWKADEYMYVLGSSLAPSEGPHALTGARGPSVERMELESRLFKFRRFVPAALTPGQARDYIRAGVTLAARARDLARVIRQNSIRILVACTGDVMNLPAGALAAKMSRIPFCAYYLEWYRGQSRSGWQRALVRAMEPWVLRSASLVLVHSGALRDRLRDLYGVFATVVPNPASSQSLASSLGDNARLPGGLFTIAYTGAVYDAYLDPLESLAVAINGLSPSPIRLAIYSGQHHAWLDRVKSMYPVVVEEPVPPARIHEVLRAANLLYLPMTFLPEWRETVEVTLPSKVGDYLASGRPILAHAPAESCLSNYFISEEGGLVVNSLEERAIEDALTSIIASPHLDSRFAVRGPYLARRDFDPARCQDIFRRALGSLLP